jgi:1-phosphatidylinositol-3-phosphate 5-kinase
MLEKSGGAQDVKALRKHTTDVFLLRLTCARYAQEVNTISMFHLRLMLRQMLSKEELPGRKEWEETLLRLALQMAQNLVLTAGRREADMDVRRYVKIKKIPGGSPRDSEYIDGAVITKNLALKQMPRQLHNPRVLFVTFPFDYNRVEGQLIGFDAMVAQEKEYLGNLVSRVAALRPHLLLVEKTVTRLGLDYLNKVGIAVARTVKPSAIQHVARMTQADIISSMDRLVVDPKLGHCAKFRVQTFEHPLIPGKRKTYLRFEGCNRDLGCTIILRGGDLAMLQKVKRVTRFLAFMVRSLKMETFLWKDSVITMPPMNPWAVPWPPMGFQGLPPGAVGFPGYSAITPTFAVNLFRAVNTQSHAHALNRQSSMRSIVVDEDELPDEDLQQLRLSRRIQDTIEPYYTTFISVSATLRFPPPYPILRVKQLDDRLHAIKRAWEDEIVSKEEGKPGHMQESTITLSTPTPRLPVTPSPPVDGSAIRSPSLNDAPGYFERGRSGSVRSSMASMECSIVSTAPSVEDELAMPANMKHTSDLALENELVLLKHDHEMAIHVWEWYLRKNKDDFVVEHYQRIAVRTYVVPFAGVDAQMPCFMPQIHYITYYGENDSTLGTFIEESCIKYISLKPGTLCTGKGCGKPQAGHCTVYVHNETRLLVATEPWDGTISTQGGVPAYDHLTTWSMCRECGKFTPFIPVSEAAQRYSFAKFLELHFYPADVQLMMGAGCDHNIYRSHIRYFAWKGMTIRFQADPISLYEPVFPGQKLLVRPEIPLELKNHDYEHLLIRNAKFWQSVEMRLRWHQSCVPGTVMSEKLAAEEELILNIIHALLNKAEAAKVKITQAIHTVYAQTSSTDTLCFGRVRQELQDESTVWEKEFERLDDLRRPVSSLSYLEKERDLRKTIVLPSRFKEMFGVVVGVTGEKDSQNQHTASTSVSETDEKSEFRKRITETDIESTDAEKAHDSKSEPSFGAETQDRDHSLGETKADGGMQQAVIGH